MFWLALFTWIYSSKINSTVGLVTLVALSFGENVFAVGEIISFFPPVGPCPIFAHPQNMRTIAKMKNFRF